MLKIIITGPESSGKTTLARQLAEHFNAPLVEEYVRVFFEKKETQVYTQQDLHDIAKGQLNNELSNMNENFNMIICDTDLLTIKIWSNEVFGNCSPELAQLIDNQLNNPQNTTSDFYFLCSPQNVDWEDDPLRENPNDRNRLFNIYEKELKFYQKKHFILRGGKIERFDKAKRIIQQIIQNSV